MFRSILDGAIMVASTRIIKKKHREFKRKSKVCCIYTYFCLLCPFFLPRFILYFLSVQNIQSLVPVFFGIKCGIHEVKRIPRELNIMSCLECQIPSQIVNFSVTSESPYISCFLMSRTCSCTQCDEQEKVHLNHSFRSLIEDSIQIYFKYHQKSAFQL